MLRFRSSVCLEYHETLTKSKDAKVVDTNPRCSGYIGYR